MPQTDVTPGLAEQRNATTDQHRNTCRRDPLNEPSSQERLYGDAAIDIGMLETPLIQVAKNGHRCSREPLDDCACRSGLQRAAAENEDRCFSVRPGVKGEDHLVGVASHHNRINRGDEFVVAVRFATARRKEIESPIQACHESVDANTNEHGRFHDVTGPVDAEALDTIPDLARYPI
jgi:hypothetical protein